MNRDSINPDCSAHQESLQRFLDGDTGAFSSADEQHRCRCPGCGAEFRAAQAMLQAIATRPVSRLPDGFGDRAVRAILADTPIPGRSVRRQIIVVTLAIAACLVLALAVGRKWTNRPPGIVTQAPPEIAIIPRPETRGLDASLTDASTALVSLTQRTVEETIEPARKLLISSAEATRIQTDPLPGKLDPAAQSLADIRDGAASSFEPMARTARRAFAMFVRELPSENKN